MQPTMPTSHPGGDPRHTFLKPQEVIARYRLGRTRGYLELKKATSPDHRGQLPTRYSHRLGRLVPDRQRTRAGRNRHRDPSCRTGPGTGSKPRRRPTSGQRHSCEVPPAPSVWSSQVQIMARLMGGGPSSVGGVPVMDPIVPPGRAAAVVAESTTGRLCSPQHGGRCPLGACRFDEGPLRGRPFIETLMRCESGHDACWNEESR
jgi:hypothetical protein